MARYLETLYIQVLTFIMSIITFIDSSLSIPAELVYFIDSSLSIPEELVYLCAWIPIPIDLQTLFVNILGYYITARMLETRGSYTSYSSKNIGSPDSSKPSKQHMLSRVLQEQEKCPLFQPLPIEIRLDIFRKLLRIPVIIHADRLVITRIADPLTPLVSYSEEIGLDATLLRTCQRIYEEGLIILYRENNFFFHGPSSLEIFKSRGLKTFYSTQDAKQKTYSTPLFNFRPARNGRFSLIREMEIVLSYDLYDFPEEYTRPLLNYRARDRAMQEWREFFMQSPHTDKHNYTRFPLLESLTLDFSDWNLGRQEEPFTPLLIERFKTESGLWTLHIRGLPNQKTLRRLREGLLRPGGEFTTS